jgi:hypothetical protein
VPGFEDVQLFAFIFGDIGPAIVATADHVLLRKCPSLLVNASDWRKVASIMPKIMGGVV